MTSLLVLALLTASAGQPFAAANSTVISQGYAPTREGTAPLDQLREDRVMRLGKLLRCAVCQGVAISDSPASMARAQLDKVRELVAADKSDQEILDYFVARYGEWVLLEPTKEGLNSILWAAPLLIVLIGFAVIVLQARRAPLAAPAPAEVASTDDFVAQVRKDLES